MLPQRLRRGVVVVAALKGVDKGLVKDKCRDRVKESIKDNGRASNRVDLKPVIRKCSRSA